MEIKGKDRRNVKTLEYYLTLNANINIICFLIPAGSVFFLADVDVDPDTDD